jgi:hypothetical protein
MSKVKSQKICLLILVIPVFILSCDKEPPVPQEDFIKAYVDLLIIQDTTTVNNFSIDSVKSVVFTRHNISSEQYDEMLRFYNAQPERWEIFFDSATAYVETLKKGAENQP